MLLHRESNVNRCNDMKSLVGYYVLKYTWRSFLFGYEEFISLQAFDFTADLSETCVGWPSCRLIFAHKTERSPRIDWGKKVVYFVERASWITYRTSPKCQDLFYIRILSTFLLLYLHVLYFHRSFVLAIVQSEKAREDWKIMIFKFNCSKQQIKDNDCSDDCEFSNLMICREPRIQSCFYVLAIRQICTRWHLRYI